MRRRVGALSVVVVVIVAVASASARADSTSATAWVRPVDGVVVRPFDPPVSRFGAGHLGADLAATPDTPVRAAGAGVVSFAGSVAGSLHVVVAHAGNLRTSYSFLATIAVRRGDTVRAGEIVGTTGGSSGMHDGRVLHFALRTGDGYVDPMQLFAAIDLATVVHLAPTSDPPRPVDERHERAGLFAGLARDFAGAARLVGNAAAATGRAAATVGRQVGKRAARKFPIVAAVVRGTTQFLTQHCDSHAPPANGEGGSGHRVMVVAGIESSLHGSESSLGLPTGRLGYAPDEVTNFSYADNGGDYGAADTEGSLVDAARRLGDQLRALQRREPGREVDLLAHSQGGVVVEVFLTQFYDPSDPSYPPLGTVVTVSSPLLGDPIATAIAAAKRNPSAHVAIELAEVGQELIHRLFPRPDAPAVQELASTSPLMRKLATSRLPYGVDLTAIGGSTDYIVPADFASRPGAQRAVETPSAFNAHTGILNDPKALQDVRAALEGKPLPCRSLVHHIVGEVTPAAISGIEAAAGRAVAGGITMGVQP